MNCHEFEATASDLASERLMDAAQRESAVAHAASCAGCASRLADERCLTGGLRFLARTAIEEAPARVEAAVLAALRQQRSTLGEVARFRTVRPRWVYAAASVAAVLLIVAVLALVASRARNSQQLAPRNAGAPNTPVPDGPRPTPAPQLSQVSPDKTEGVERRKPSEPVKKVRSNRPSSAINRPTREPEIATDFIPLMNRETFDEMDGGQVMRVELPRSALMSFGLPMDMERATEPIKADVVVGNDGLARAIRFVR